MTDFLADFRYYLATRRSTPFPMFDEPGPNDVQLKDILTLAARVPDHGKLAPWRFIVISRHAGRALSQKLAEMGKSDGADEKRIEMDAQRFCRTPLCIAVVSRAENHPKIPVWEQQLSAGAACLNLIHAAKAHGFGAVWVTEWPAYDRRVADELGLAAHEKIAGFVHIGTASGKAEDRTRPDMNSIISHYGA